MSEHENRQLVEQAYATFKAGDIPTLLQSLSDRARLHRPRRSDRGLPRVHGLSRGRQSVPLGFFCTNLAARLERSQVLVGSIPSVGLMLAPRGPTELSEENDGAQSITSRWSSHSLRVQNALANAARGDAMGQSRLSDRASITSGLPR